MKVKLLRLQTLNARMPRTDDTLIGTIFEQGEAILPGSGITIWHDDDTRTELTEVTKVICRRDNITVFETKNSMYQLEVLE